MSSASAKLACVALIILMAVAPAAARPGQRRGADLVVTRLDGTRVSGELIAVRPDSLLLLSDGADVSIDLPAIGSVVIARKSRAGLLAGMGGGAGLFAGALLGLNAFDDEHDELGLAAVTGLFLGAAGALSGLIVGSVFDIDSKFKVAGRSPEVLDEYWRRLADLSRQGRRLGDTGPLTAGPARAPTPSREAPPRSGPRPKPRPRFRLNLGASIDFPQEIHRHKAGSFRFPGEAPPEAGPYVATFALTRGSPLERRFRLTGVDLAYELTPRLAVETEVFFLGTERRYASANLTFRSSLDGLDYSGTTFASLEAGFSGFLVGLAFRPLGPSVFDRHIIEIGAAVGPAQARGEARFLQFVTAGESHVIRKTFLAGRVRAAYDFYPIPSVSLGMIIDWRLARTSLSGLVAEGSNYYEGSAGGSPVSFRRPTEIELPSLDMGKSGLYWGLRLGIRI